MTQSLDALVARNPAALPLAERARATENRVEVAPGEGIWRTVTARRPYRVDFIDPREGVAAVRTVLEENGTPLLFAARLKVVDRLRPGSLPGRGGGGQSLVTFEAFKVYGGQVHAAEAIFDAAPVDAGSGGTELGRSPVTLS